MPKEQYGISRYANKYPPKRETFNRNSLQNQVRTSSPQEKPAFALSPLASFTHTAVTVGILVYGFYTANLQLLYTACFMASAPLGPSALKILFAFIRENLGSKASEK